MNRIDRLFGILTQLQSKKYVTADKIAEKFNISVRTVYRDIKALIEQGIPVSFEPTRGYFIVQGYFLPPVSFSSDEANAMLLMEAIVTGFADKSIHTHYSAALNKIKSVLGSAQKEKLESLTDNIRYQFPECVQNNSEYLSLLQQAISNKKIIELDYGSKAGEISRRKLEPIGLIFYAFNWHLIAWCHLRADYRDFKITRIMKLCITGQPFTKPDHIALKDYMKMLPVDY